MPCCVAYKCSNRTERTKISFFRFPFSDKDRLQKWIRNVKRQNWTPTKHSRLCSLHFTQDCFIYTQKQVTLTHDAVPTLFYPRLKATEWHTKSRKNSNKQVPNRPFFETIVSKTYFKVADPKDVSHDHFYDISDPVNATTVDVDVPSDIVPVDVDVPSDTMADQVDVNSETMADQADVNNDTMTEINAPSSIQPSDHSVYTQKYSRRVKKNGVAAQNDLSLKEKLRLQNQRVRRLKEKVTYLSSIVSDLKEKLFISASCDMLDSSRGRLAKEILLRTRTRRKSAKISDDLRSFAIQLHSFSAKAYKFVRDSFDRVLPHPTSLSVKPSTEGSIITDVSG
ncbi:hypothetical protein ACEWY4_011904 [Coilia grayii]|uniref:THAP-type domain-containing protein n=1 Tax=Coilia grayii TaxID=363190 RepID=A0ABD1JZ18_9TELE